ncbi:MAG: outer membrane lipoprotein carrier protein LolA [Treponema sp.]|nr:outer membrane lipoprotein carrier protein LolA [Treponema sp.]
MKRSTFIIGILFAFTAFTAFAEKATIDSVCTSIASHKVTTGSFVQEKTNGKSSRVLKSNGTFILSPEGVGLSTVKPLKTFQGITQTSVIRTTPDGSRSVIDVSNNQMYKSISQIVVSLFNGDKTELEKNFSIQFTATESSWQMTLTPKDKTIASSVGTITLGGNAATGKISLDSLVIDNASGGKTAYTFSEQKYKEVLSDAEKALFARK